VDSTNQQLQPVTVSDVFQLASWNRERSDDELQSFLNRREQELATLDSDE